jgi:LPS-assembly protein
VTSFVVSPYGGNPNKIPNEDSPELEFDDSNLFKQNRFTGVDRVEGGPRVSYGLRWGVFGDKSGSTTAFIGQSYRVRDDDTFAQGSGLEDNLSDIVGRVRIAPARYANVTYRTRVDKEDLAPKRHEVRANVGVPALTISTNYMFFDNVSGGAFPKREELTLGAGSRINRFWRAGASMTRDLLDSGTRNVGVNLIYEDECLVFTVIAQRHFFQDRDLKPDDTILLRVNFKTLGEVFTSVSAN